MENPLPPQPCAESRNTYQNHVETLKDLHPELAEEIAPFQGLGLVFEWLTARAIDLRDLEILPQDEYQYDMLIPLAEKQWLVFGVT